MYIKDLKHKINQQRAHLFSARNLLITQFKLKKAIKDLVRYSEEKLNQVQQENPSSDTTNNFSAKLADDRHLYAECKDLIRQLQAEITVTEKRIKKSKLKLHHIRYPQKTCGFFKQKNDGGQTSNFSPACLHSLL